MFCGSWQERVIYRKRKMESVAIPEHLIKLLPVAQPGAFDLVGYVIYDVEEKPYQSVFYNGTIEVVEFGGLLSRESVFLLTLGIALLLLLGLWAYSQEQHLTKKTKNVSKVEVGTRFTDASRVARETFGKDIVWKIKEKEELRKNGLQSRRRYNNIIRIREHTFTVYVRKQKSPQGPHRRQHVFPNTAQQRHKYMTKTDNLKALESEVV